MAARAWLGRRVRLDDGLLVGCAAFGLGAGMLALHGVPRLDAFAIQPSITMDFVPSAAASGQDAYALLAGAQVLFTARAGLIALLPPHGPIAMSRLVVAAGVAGLCLAVLWRMPAAPRGGVAQLLVLAALCLAGLAAMSATVSVSIEAGAAFPGAAVRYVVPMFVFLCLAAAIEFGARLAGRGPAALRLAALIGLALASLYAIGGAAVAARAAGRHPAIRTMPQRVLADRLRAHGLAYGVGDYWDTQLVTALTGRTVVADPVIQADGRLTLFAWLTDTARFRGGRRPQFAIITPDSKFGITPATVTATYGGPCAWSRSPATISSPF